MNSKEIIKLIKRFTQKELFFEIRKDLFDCEDGRKKYNEVIRKQVDKKYGVYLWRKPPDNEIIYIGMAGKIKQNGKYGTHDLRKRLIASRRKEKKTKKDIQTNDFILSLMKEYKLDQLTYHIYYTKKNIAPAFVEALLLQKYLKKNGSLPLLNNNF